MGADAAGRTALHRAAERGDIRAIDAHLADLPPPARGAALAQQDVWGDTPLHKAVVHAHHLACIERLLDYGAPCDTPGTLGRPPRLVARTLGHQAVEQALAARGGSLALGPLNEPAWRSVLGEVFGLRGTTTLGRAILPLHHGIAEAAFPLLGAGLRVVAPQLGSAADRADGVRIAIALEAAGLNISAEPQSLADRIAAGELVILPAGSPLHAVAYVWAGGHALRCDRGHRLLRPWGRSLCTVLSARAQRLDAEALRLLQRAPFTPSLAASRLASRLDRARPADLPAALRAQVRGHPLRPQQGHRCVTASAKASIFAALCLLPGARTPEETARLYKRITTLLRWHLLRGYQSRPGACPDAGLVHACETKLAKPQRRAVWP